MKKAILIILGLHICLSLFSSYGVYKIVKIETKKIVKLNKYGDNQKWVQTNLYDNYNTHIVRLMSKTEVEDRKINLTYTVKNMMQKTIRFYLVFETNYLIIKSDKIVLFAGKSLTRKNIIFYTSGHYEHIDWGFAFYKKFITRRNYSGKGLIEHW